MTKIIIKIVYIKIKTGKIILTKSKLQNKQTKWSNKNNKKIRLKIKIKKNMNFIKKNYKNSWNNLNNF